LSSEEDTATAYEGGRVKKSTIVYTMTLPLPHPVKDPVQAQRGEKLVGLKMMSPDGML